MYDENGADGKRRYTVAEIAETFHVSRKTIYRHLDRGVARQRTAAGEQPAAEHGEADRDDPGRDGPDGSAGRRAQVRAE